MDRIESVRQHVDKIVLNMTNHEERRCAYLHLYGVAQACALLSIKRGENSELAVIAGMLHDIYTYSKMDPMDHAHKGSVIAREILDSLGLFDDEEKNLICTAIYHHSDKANVHRPFDEILKDADVMQHVLYNPLFNIMPHEQKRFDAMKAELGLD